MAESSTEYSVLSSSFLVPRNCSVYWVFIRRIWGIVGVGIVRVRAGICQCLTYTVGILLNSRPDPMKPEFLVRSFGQDVTVGPGAWDPVSETVGGKDLI